MKTCTSTAPEKINKGKITADQQGRLEFALDIKKEELEKFFNAYLHEIEIKNKTKDILLITSNAKAEALLQAIKDILVHFNQSIALTEPTTLGMAERLVKNVTFRELIYILLDEKTQTFKLVLTKNKKALAGQNIFDMLQKMQLFCPRSFGVAPCNYTRKDLEYKKTIVTIINSIYLTLEKAENNSAATPCSSIFFETENAFIKTEAAKLLPLFGLKISSTVELANFVFEVDGWGEKIETVRCQKQTLNRELYLSYLHQKSIRKNLKIYIKNKDIYFLSNNLPIIARFSKKIKDVLCEAYLFAMISKTKAFTEYSLKNELPRG
jgi:hypothetical protein